MRSDKIREDAKKAEDLIRSLKHKGAEQDSKPDADTERLEEIVTSKLTEQPEQLTQSANDEVPKTEAGTHDEEVVENSRYKAAVKAMNEAQRRSAELQRELETQKDERAKFLEQIALTRMTQEQETTKVEAEVEEDTELKRLEEELPDTVRVAKAQAQRIKREFEKTTNPKLLEVEKQLTELKSMLERTKLEESISKRDDNIRLKHEDYDSIRTSEEFRNWIYTDAPSFYKGAYEGSIAFNDSDGMKIISDYKAARGIETKTERKKLPSAEVAVKTKSSVSNIPPREEQLISPEEMEQLPYMLNRIKDPAKRKALMDKADQYLNSLKPK